jgi:hypothetical protein
MSEEVTESIKKKQKMEKENAPLAEADAGLDAKSLNKFSRQIAAMGELRNFGTLSGCARGSFPVEFDAVPHFVSLSKPS